MADISLILPRTKRGNFDHPFPPLGILYLGAALESNGFKVEVIDGNVLPELSYEEALIGLSGELIGVSVTFFHLPELRRILPILKLRNRPIVVGGPGVSSIMDKERFLRETGVDMLLEGEAEEILVDLMNSLDAGSKIDCIPGLYRLCGNTLVGTGGVPRVDVNQYPIPARHIVNMEMYTSNWGNYTGMIISRGCPFKCSFCDLSVPGHKVRYRSLNNVMQEFHALQDMGIEDVFIFDDLFTVNREYLQLLAERRLQDSIRLAWGGNARIDLICDELLRTVVTSGGTRLFMGVESGSQRMLEIYNKRIKLEQTIRAFDLCWKYDIRPCAYVLIGHPRETWEDVRQTANLIARIRPSYLDISILTPIPGTPLYDQTKHLINMDRLNKIDTRLQDTVYDLRFDINEGIALLKQAHGE
jgi:radical SAM superfamily enzyme YgiQ (UPF0313 family)